MKTMLHLIKSVMLAVAAMVFPEAMAASSSETILTEYRGNVIYKDGKIDMVLFPGGFNE